MTPPASVTARLRSPRGQLGLIGAALLGAAILGLIVGRHPGFFRGTQALAVPGSALSAFPAADRPTLQDALGDGELPAPSAVRAVFLAHPSQARGLVTRAALAGTPRQRARIVGLVAAVDLPELTAALSQLADHARRTGDAELSALLAPALGVEAPDIVPAAGPGSGPPTTGDRDE